MGRLSVAAVVVVSLTAGAAGALGEGTPTRREYVAQLEPICKPGAEATERVMKGVRDDVDAGRIAVAAHKFGRATTVFGETTSTIGRVPQPPADTARLKQWFGYLDRQQGYLKEITAELRAGHTIKAQRLTARFIHTGNLANNVVLAFGFDYCSFRFSRFR